MSLHPREPGSTLKVVETICINNICSSIVPRF